MGCDDCSGGRLTLPRRAVVRKIGGWTIFSLAAAACGRTPLGAPFGLGDDITTPTGTLTPTPTPTTPTPTPTPSPCTCSPASGADILLKTSDVAVGNVAYKSGYEVFICHDSLGFYAMSVFCTHAGYNMGGHPPTGHGIYSETNLAGGFTCNHANSHFAGDGTVTQGPAPLDLPHYLLTVDSNLHLLVNTLIVVAKDCRCT